MNVYYRILAIIYLVLLKLEKSECFVETCEPVVSTDSPPPSVTIPGFATFNGSVTLSLRKRREIFQYLGIPFALPPMGPWRFKAPVRLNSLNPNTVYKAQHFKPKCPQYVTDEDYAYLSKNQETAEDCLYLNVFTVTRNDENSKSLLPVLIYLHGGGYYQNSAMNHCPNYLLDHDIILVTVQYRLGPFGFLNLESEDIMGNMGLMDQLEALEWVSRYIRYFGGDNQRITISGQSAGGVTVSLMLTSPLVRQGLFQQAIVQSGNSLINFVFDYNSKQNAVEFARYVNCTQKNMIELAECLRSVSSLELVKANTLFTDNVMKSTKQAAKGVGINHVVIQNGLKMFLTEDPEISFKNGNFLKIPIMTGVTKDEGLMFIEGFVDYVVDPALANYSSKKINHSEYLKYYLFYDFLKFIGVSNNVHYFEILQDVYFPDGIDDDFNSTVPGLSDLAGALIFKANTLQFARYTSGYAPTYLYSFDFKGEQTVLGYGKPPKKFYFNGVAHSDELIYLFPYKNYSLNDAEVKVVEHITSLWSSFVINGGKSVSAPDLPKWPPMSTLVGPYLQIDEKLTIKNNFVNTYMTRENNKTVRSSAYRNCIFFLLPLCTQFVILILK